VGAGAVDGAVVLGDVIVEGPGAEGVGHLFVGGPEFLVGVAFFNKGVFRGVVAEEIEVGVGEVGLEADRFGHPGGLEGVEHVLPGVHAAPADFAFGGDALPMIDGDFAGALEGVGDKLGVAGGVFGPVVGAPGSVDADDAGLAHAVVIKELGDAGGLFNREDEIVTILLGAEGGASDGAGPDGGDEGSDLEPVARDLVRHLLEGVVGEVGIGVGVEDEQIHAVEFLALDFGGDGELEHVVERDRWVVGAVFFSDEAGPHRVMEGEFAHSRVLR